MSEEERVPSSPHEEISRLKEQIRQLEEEEEDVQLDEFTDEIEPWVIEELKKIGLTTAQQVLKAPREMIIKEADLEEETVDEALRVLAAEFEDEEEQ